MSGTVLVYGESRDWRRRVHRALVDGGLRVLLASSMAEGAKCLAGGAVDLVVVPDDASEADAERLRADLSRQEVVDETRAGHGMRLLRLPDVTDANDVLAPVRAALAG